MNQAKLQNPELELSVRWLPYELTPDIPEEPFSKTDWLCKRLGVTRDQFMEVVGAVKSKMATVGLVLKDDCELTHASSRESHRLLTLAYKAGGFVAQDAASEVFFRGHFTEGRPVNDPALMEEAAAAAGLDTTVIGDRSVGRVELDEELRAAREHVTQGVPHYIIYPEGKDNVIELFGDVLDGQGTPKIALGQFDLEQLRQQQKGQPGDSPSDPTVKTMLDAITIAVG